MHHLAHQYQMDPIRLCHLADQIPRCWRLGQADKWQPNLLGKFQRESRAQELTFDRLQDGAT